MPINPFPGGIWPRSISGYTSVTPLTERDGATLIELFTALRTWIENDVVNQIESEIDRLVNAYNDSSEALGAAIDEAKHYAEEAQRISDALGLVEARVAAHAADVAADRIAVASDKTTVGEIKTDVLGIQAMIQDLVNGVTSDSILRTILGNLSGISRQYLDSLYLLTDAEFTAHLQRPIAAAKLEEIYYRRPRKNAVFIGSSNVDWPGSWYIGLSAKEGWTPRNFAKGGTGYTQGDETGDNTFMQQLQKAAGSTAFANADVGTVWIGDAGNDVRGDKSVSVAATTLYEYATTTFPNARVIVVPILWGHSDDGAGATPAWNDTRASWVSLNRVANELRVAARRANVEFIDYSWLWHLGVPSYMLAGQVHYTQAGHNEIEYNCRAYLRGESVIPQQPWRKVASGAPSVNIVESVGGHRPLSVSRTLETVILDGHMTSTGITPANSDWAVIPKGYRPIWPIDVAARIVNTNETVRVIIYPNGYIRVAEARGSFTPLLIHVTYSIT